MGENLRHFKRHIDIMFLVRLNYNVLAEPVKISLSKAPNKLDDKQ